MKEIQRESLHKSIKEKSKELQDIFLEVANKNIAKGYNYSMAVSEATKAMQEQEIILQKKKQEELNKQVEINKAKIVQNIKETFPEIRTNFEPQVQEEVDPEEIKSIYFNDQGKLVIEFQDGFKITSKNSLPSNYITQHVSVAAQYPFFDWIQFNTDPDIPDSDKLPGMLFWNEFEDCLDVVQSDGTSLQLGLEHYIQVKNNTLQDMPNGAVVMFSGVDLEEIPTCTLMLSSGEIDPLFIIGVMTTDIPAGQMGRATVFGKVRNLDTSAYNQGDLLWVSTTTPGQLTNVKPSAPNPAISVAAVLKVHATEGVLLVRPVIYPRLFYGVFNSSQTQTPVEINTPYAVTLNETEFSSGVVLQNSSEIKVLHAGLYSFDFRMQVTSSNSSQKNIYIWARKNGVDIPNTATKVTLVGNGVEAAPSWNFMHSMNINDVFQIMYAVDNTAMSINAPSQTAFCPSTPSVTLRVSRFDL